MLLNFLWFGLILLAFVSDLLTGMPFSSGMDGLSGARAGLELALTLAGPVCLWSGLSQAMERAGLTEWLYTALRPVLRRLFLVCAKDSESFWNLCGNTASLQLIPSTVAAVRAQLGAAHAFDILPAVWLASACSVGAGILAAKGLKRCWRT